MEAFLRTNAIPRLELAEVPHEFALAFLRSRPLNILSVWRSTVVNLNSATSIIQGVVERHPRFSKLSATLNAFSIPWFISMIELPYLECLSLSVDDNVGMEEDVLKEVRTTKILVTR